MKRILFSIVCISLIPTVFADVNTPNKNAQLIQAAYDGDLQTVQTLLADGAEVNARNNRGVTALIMAAMEGHTEVAKFLLEKGADINAKSNNGLTALVAARSRGYTDIVQLLGKTVTPAVLIRKDGPRLAWQGGKVGYIDHTGKMIIEPQYASALEFSEDMAAVLLGDKWGFVNDQGKVVVPAQFDKCSSFSEGFSAVALDGKWKFIDRQGNLTSNTVFEMARNFSGGLAAVKVDGKWGYVDQKMTLVIKPTFDDAWYFREGLAPVKIGSKWGYVDTTGRVAIEPHYYWADEFSEGLAFVEGGTDNEGYIDKTGKLVIARRFFSANPFSHGLAAVLTQAGGTYGLIDRSGQMVVPAQFEEVRPFSEGLAPVRVKYKWGYIDPNGKTVIEPNFFRAEGFSGGLALVSDDKGKVSYIDKSANLVWAPSANQVSPPPQDKSKPPAPTRRIRNPVMKVQLDGPNQVPPKEVVVVGNPFRKRFPDNMDWKEDKPSVFARNVWDMVVYDGRIYLGSGDYWNNAGPTDIYCFVPGQNQFTLDYTAPDEMVSKFYIFEGKLVVPGNDPQESWDFGNIYIKESGAWRKVRTIPNGLHCFNMAYAQGTLFAGIGTEHAPKLLASKNWGQTWEPVVFKSFPGTLFTWNSQLFAFDFFNNLCRYENGVLYSDKVVPEGAQSAKDVASSWPGWRCTEAIPFAGGLILVSAGIGTTLEYGPFPLLFIEPNQTEASVIGLFEDKNVMDTCVSGETLYALCTRPAAEGTFENTIYSTRDVRTWHCEVTFTTTSFTRSFVETGGDFYVGIGCSGLARGSLPNSTGDILRVIRKTEK